ncbi:hypothetical protein [Streptomyces sp. NPDC090021]|uniref:hypothetical protein n=1 Tax=Streptomyces sp. NPDC090021 TaxID=3365919 RepID=UPI0038003E75
MTPKESTSPLPLILNNAQSAAPVCAWTGLTEQVLGQLTVDAAVLGVPAFARICATSAEMGMVVTDTGLAPPVARAFTASGAEVLTA